MREADILVQNQSRRQTYMTMMSFQSFIFDSAVAIDYERLQRNLPTKTKFRQLSSDEWIVEKLHPPEFPLTSTAEKCDKLSQND